MGDLKIDPNKPPPFGGGAPTGRRGPRGNLSQPAAEELVSSVAAGAVGADSGFGLLPDGARTVTRYACPRCKRRENGKYNTD